MLSSFADQHVRHTFALLDLFFETTPHPVNITFRTTTEESAEDGLHGLYYKHYEEFCSNAVDADHEHNPR